MASELVFAWITLLSYGPVQHRSNRSGFKHGPQLIVDIIEVRKERRESTSHEIDGYSVLLNQRDAPSVDASVHSITGIPAIERPPDFCLNWEMIRLTRS
jgi:hypothetical protein